MMGLDSPEPITEALTPGILDRLCISEPPKFSSMYFLSAFTVLKEERICISFSLLNPVTTASFNVPPFLDLTVSVAATRLIVSGGAVSFIGVP